MNARRNRWPATAKQLEAVAAARVHAPLDRPPRPRPPIVRTSSPLEPGKERTP